MMDIGTILPSSDRFGKYTCKPKTRGPTFPQNTPKQTWCDMNLYTRTLMRTFLKSFSSVLTRLRRCNWKSLQSWGRLTAPWPISLWWWLWWGRAGDEVTSVQRSALCWVRQLICSNINWTDAESLTLLRTPPSCSRCCPASSSGHPSPPLPQAACPSLPAASCGELGHPSGEPLGWGGGGWRSGSNGFVAGEDHHLL